MSSKEKEWNLQSEKDIRSEPLCWATTFFDVIMKDGTERVVAAYLVDQEIGYHYFNFYPEGADNLDCDDILLWKKYCMERITHEEIVKYRDKEGIRLLRKELEKHNYNYYVLNQPTTSDYEYDMMMKRLEDLERKYPEFDSPDSPTHQVGSDLK